ncbi:amino acid adenylation domain-containing protein [Neorhodopirellula pilleata]|uniref:Linear gramicidin synthase subunit D n=1 Tax=Neorhodopirellula pilleata TaxID=2714738 RepID=A0A5C6AV07_9BACT|nr:amino acid adenylation domain-containing protein [Neorhodopirellula pilleata]TWU03317.1 Linear gramicidin synthase subunit D [Neorhodopirellula pilleata]
MSTASLEELNVTILSSWSIQCERHAESIAIEFEGRTWTYRQLDQIAGGIAAWLIQDGLKVGESVGLCLDRSADAIAAMLGVMKSGGVFVPLDPEYPADRIAYMIDDAAATRVIGHDRYRGLFEQVLEQNEQVRWIDANTLMGSTSEVSVNLPDIDPAALAYIMYTSGSTGKPKGVEISHSSLAVYCDADIECYHLTAADRTLQFSTLCFDIAIEEIFPPLLTGGTVVVRPRERSDDANELSSIIDQNNVTAIHLATAYWHQWVDLMVATGAKVPASLRLVIATGEKVSVEHYHRWKSLCAHDVLWCNAYGPTETTVTATVFIPDDDFDSPHMPIGKPLKRYTAFILDEDLQPVGDGQTGHLFIGGPALAIGYHHREDLTRRAFVDTTIDGVARRLYRTGDLARWLPDGNIDFAGRVDHQIKLGSYRIEPGEIEAVMNQLPGVLESLVVYEQVETQKFLIAYVATQDELLTADQLANGLRTSLPAYMIPSRYAFLESFPKTINGKIDRPRLPDPSLALTIGGDDYVAPRNDLERRLVTLWGEVLNVPRIGIHDDFFLLGGSSLLVTQVITRLTTDMDFAMPVRDFFANPTVATLARHLQSTHPDLFAKFLTDSEPIDQDAQREADLVQLRRRLPTATPLFFHSGLAEDRIARLYAVEYRPPEAATVSDRTSPSAVLLCHPIGHEYTRAYRNLQQLAVALSNAGHHVMRFDYFGTGNSDGDCDAATSTILLQNIRDAHSEIVSRSGIMRVDVVGLRLGALLAAEVGPNLFDRTILWDPVLDGETMLRMFDQFHQQQLVGLTRYERPRTESIFDQSYGHAMSPEKRDSISSLRIRPLTENDFVVVSDGYLSSLHDRDWLMQQPHRTLTHDVIGWDDPRYTESAFSSPDSFQQIVSLLGSDQSFSIGAK